MRILLIAATEFEIAPTKSFWGTFSPGKITLDVSICGIGMLATAFHLTKAIGTHRPDLVLQVGIAGAFNRELALGDPVFVETDLLADLGVEDKETYRDVFDIGLMNNNEKPFTKGILRNPADPQLLGIDLKKCSGLTVNTVSGHLPTIQMRSDQYGADVESMEGAALHYVGLQEDILFAQVRAISNYVEPRNKDNWQMQKAICNLNEWLIAYLVKKAGS